MYKISIVTVSFNCSDTIEETIKSVLCQTYKNIEYVIIDGASTDGTLSIIERYSTQLAYWVSEKDKGIFDAMNKSLDHISGDYILYLNAGDKFVNNHIVEDVFNRKYNDEDLIYGSDYMQNEYGYILRIANDIYSHKPSKRDLVMRGQQFCHQSLFTKTLLLKRIRFDLNYPLGADYDTTAKIFYKGNHKIKNVGFPVSIFDDRHGGTSHNRDLQVIRERCVMFDYKLNLIDYISIKYQYIWKPYLRNIIKKLFPLFVAKVRAKKYLKTIG